MVGLPEWILLGLLGAILFLDAWPVAQTMLSRPIVAGPLTAILLGAPAEGVFWGAVFEAVYLGILPVGAARYPDAGLATLVGTVLAVVAGSPEPTGYLVAVAFAAGALGQWASGFLRRWNGRTAKVVESSVAAGDLNAPGRAIGVAVSRGALIGAAAAVGSSPCRQPVSSTRGPGAAERNRRPRRITASAAVPAAGRVNGSTCMGSLNAFGGMVSGGSRRRRSASSKGGPNEVT